MTNPTADLIHKALTRFRDLTQYLDCECDADIYTCSIHSDRALANEALAATADPLQKAITSKSLSRLTREKTETLLEKGMTITGFILTDPTNHRKCSVDMSRVTWLTATEQQEE